MIKIFFCFLMAINLIGFCFSMTINYPGNEISSTMPTELPKVALPGHWKWFKDAGKDNTYNSFLYLPACSIETSYLSTVKVQFLGKSIKETFQWRLTSGNTSILNVNTPKKTSQLSNFQLQVFGVPSGEENWQLFPKTHNTAFTNKVTNTLISIPDSTKNYLILTVTNTFLGEGNLSDLSSTSVNIPFVIYAPQMTIKPAVGNTENIFFTGINYRTQFLKGSITLPNNKNLKTLVQSGLTPIWSFDKTSQSNLGLGNEESYISGSWPSKVTGNSFKSALSFAANPSSTFLSPQQMRISCRLETADSIIAYGEYETFPYVVLDSSTALNWTADPTSADISITPKKKGGRFASSIKFNSANLSEKSKYSVLIIPYFNSAPDSTYVPIKSPAGLSLVFSKSKDLTAKELAKGINLNGGATKDTPVGTYSYLIRLKDTVGSVSDQLITVNVSSS